MPVLTLGGVFAGCREDHYRLALKGAVAATAADAYNDFLVAHAISMTCIATAVHYITLKCRRADVML
jgi:hypothetical protein